MNFSSYLPTLLKCSIMPSTALISIDNKVADKAREWQPSPLSRVLQKLIFIELLKKFLAFYGTRRFTMVFTTVRPVPRPFVAFYNMLNYTVKACNPRPTLKLEIYLLSAVCNYLLSISAISIHIWRPSSPSSNCGHAKGQGTYLTWFEMRDIKGLLCVNNAFISCNIFSHESSQAPHQMRSPNRGTGSW